MILHSSFSHRGLLKTVVFLVCVACFICEQFATQAEDSQSQPYLVIAGDSSKRPTTLTKAKKVVLVSGDEEYRSEEAIPMLAQILAKTHGFDCVALFSINPETSSVDPQYTGNIPGLSHLDDADVLILFTRFRELPDEQMKHFEDFLLRGGSIIALRTATHAFNFASNSQSRYANWTWTSKEWPGGFGQQILGETWHTHHGNHKVESTRGIIESTSKDDPILQGVADLWGPSDVYGVVHLPSSAKVLVRGQVLSGMDPTDAAVEGNKNSPMMPLAWTKDYQYRDGKNGKVFCTTFCSSIDLLCEDLRRMIVNATYWAADLEASIPEHADVPLPATYKPSFFGFMKEPDHFKRQNLQPSDFLR